MVVLEQSASVMVTGATGNLGGKLVDHLIACDWCERIVAVDRDAARLSARFSRFAKVVTLAADLTEPDPAGLTQAVASVDTIVHFAILNQLPDSTWAQAAYSIEMTTMLLLKARDLGLRRFVFPSSNHTLGRYKEPPLFETLTPGLLTTDLFAPGTRWETFDGMVDAYAYGASKVFGERMCVAAAQAEGLSTVSIRIGWCQDGDNLASSLSASGNPDLVNAGVASKSGDAELRWFRNMWLSNGDFADLFDRAILARPAGWPRPGIVVNGMSANTGMAWDIEPTRQLLGYAPKDDVWCHV
jgi:hypothetical protein